MPDYSDQFNTQLSADMERAFTDWAKESGRVADLSDYDLRGAFKAGLVKSPGHLPDSFKKPNHPTFSNESIYASDKYPGGEWLEQAGRWTFEPSKLNLELHGVPGLQEYFRQTEPDAYLALPMSSQVRVPAERGLSEAVSGAPIRNPRPATLTPGPGGVRG